MKIPTQMGKSLCKLPEMFNYKRDTHDYIAFYTNLKFMHVSKNVLVTCGTQVGIFCTVLPYIPYNRR